MVIHGIFIKRYKQIVSLCMTLMIVVIIKVFCFPTYETEGLLLVDMKKRATTTDPFLIDANQQMSLVRRHIHLLYSKPVLRSVVEHTKIYEDLVSKHHVAALDTKPLLKEKCIRKSIDSLRKKYILLGSPVFTNLIEVKVKYKNAQKAAAIANTLMDTYRTWNIQFQHCEVDPLIEYLSEELTRARHNLTMAEQKLKTFREQHKIVDIRDEIKTYLLMCVEEYKAHAGMLLATEVKLLDLDIELSRLKELYADTSPQVLYMKRRIKQVQGALIKAAKKCESSKDYINTMRDIPAKEMIFSRLLRDVKLKETLTTFLAQELQKAKLLKEKETIQEVRVASYAEIPLKPKGRLIQLFFGSIAAFFFSFALAFILEIKQQLS